MSIQAAKYFLSRATTGQVAKVTGNKSHRDLGYEFTYKEFKQATDEFRANRKSAIYSYRRSGISLYTDCGGGSHGGGGQRGCGLDGCTQGLGNHLRPIL